MRSAGDTRAGPDHVIDGVQDVLAGFQIGRGQQVVELLHRLRPDDDRSDREMADYEGQREMSDRQPGLSRDL
jgi:hypothetical protein